MLYKKEGKFDKDNHLIALKEYRGDTLERMVIINKNNIIFINCMDKVKTITNKQSKILYQEATINGKKYWKKFFYNALNQGCKIIKSDGRCLYGIYKDEDLVDIITKTGISYLVNPHAFNEYWSIEDDKWKVFGEHSIEINFMYGFEI